MSNPRFHLPDVLVKVQGPVQPLQGKCSWSTIQSPQERCSRSTIQPSQEKCNRSTTMHINMRVHALQLLQETIKYHPLQLSCFNPRLIRPLTRRNSTGQKGKNGNPNLEIFASNQKFSTNHYNYHTKASF